MDTVGPSDNDKYRPIYLEQPPITHGENCSDLEDIGVDITKKLTQDNITSDLELWTLVKSVYPVVHY